MAYGGSLEGFAGELTATQIKELAKICVGFLKDSLSEVELEELKECF